VDGECEELDLLAFRYVAGEMPPLEAATFEARLADDQAARLAVSRAVGLSQLLAAATSPAAEPAAPVRKNSLAWAQPLGWMAIGAAAAVLAISVFSRQGRGPEVGPPIVQPASGAAPVDALVWARLQADQELAAADLAGWLEEPLADDADEPQLTAEVPSWVFAAKRTPPRGVNP